MGAENGRGTSGRDPFVDPSDVNLEPEIIRWLRMYARAADDRLDATVAAILEEVNRLLRRYRGEGSVNRADYGSRLRALTEHMPVIVWTTDDELRVTSFSGGGLAEVAIEPASGVSLLLADLLQMGTPSSRPMSAHERALQGQSGVYEYDWRSRSYLAHVEPLSSPDGAVVGTVGLAIDVTERKRADEAARSTQRMLAHLLECFPNGAIGVLDTELRHVMAAGRGLAEAGLTPEQMIGKALAELYPPEVAAVMEGAHRRACAGETVTFDLACADRHYTLTAAPLDRADGAVRTIVIVCQDITERVRADEERAVQRERQARLDGMLFVVRDLASHLTGSLAAAPEAGDGPDPGSTAPASRDEVLDTAAALSKALEEIVELQRLFPPE